jgi:ribose-phosphate pyrophosphokinase
MDLKIFSGSSHPALSQKICDHIGIPLGQCEIIKFSNENLFVKILENVREKDVFVIQTSFPPVNENIIELLIMVDALKHASAARVTAVLPYFPYARSDKKDQPRISIAARLMADLLEAAGTDRILTVDLHSPQVQGFFRIPVDHLRAVPIICEYLKKQDLADHVLVAGDAGEAKDVGRYGNRLQLPMAIIDKRRTGNDEKPVVLNLIGDVKNKHVIIIDDEIATGGTIIESAEFLSKFHVKSIRCAVVHPILSNKSVEKIKNSNIAELVTTDSIPIPKEKMIDKITVLSISELFAKAILNVHNGESVSALFT